MRREAQEQLLLRMTEMMDSETTTLVESERLNRVSEYWDPVRLEGEQRQLLRSLPVVVGHSYQVQAPGSVVVSTLPGFPVVIVRTTSGEIRVLIHEQAVDPDNEVSAATTVGGVKLVCAAHGTELLVEGELATSGDSECFTEVPAEVRHGIVWAVLTPGKTIDVAAHLGEIDDEFAGYGLENYVYERDYVFHEDLNWKSVIDGFLENYHVKFLHADSLLKYLRTNVHLFDAFGQHTRLGVLKTSYDKVRHLPLAEIDPLKYLSFVYVVFPNTVISWVGDHFDSWTSFPEPGNPNRSATRFSMWVPESTVENHDFWDRSAQTVLDVIPTEDFLMARLMQEGLVAGAQPYQVFGRNEGALQHFHEQLELVLGPAR